jgi:hypothetical protein
MVHVTKWRVPVAFISILVTHSLLITLKYRQYSAIADLHTLYSTVAHALGFSVSTSRLLATDLRQKLALKSLQVLHIKSCNHTLNPHRPSTNFLLAVSYRELKWTSNDLRCPLQTFSMDHKENTASIAETCLPKHCIATVAARIP